MGWGMSEAGLYTPEVVHRIRTNYVRYDWAKDWVDWERAENFAAMDDEVLWTLPPSQDVGRAKGSAPWYPGCPICGSKDGYSPVAPLIDWRVRCRGCGEVFPKNDFARFYASGLDEQGTFRRALADARSLFNSEYPDPHHPFHRFAVDDGTGWVDERGRRHFFVAVAADSRWEELLAGLRDLARAYLLSGERLYAHKAFLLLYRFADLYPEMDFAPYARLGALHNDGGSGRGRIFGRIGECGVASVCSEAYDMVRDAVDPELLSFLSARTGKPLTAEEVRNHIETGLLREFLRSFGERPPRIRGNFGYTHYVYALVSLILGDREALARLFSHDWDENLDLIFTHYIRDGIGAEGSPGYSIGWTRDFLALAELLERTTLGREFSLYRRYGEVLRRMVLAPRRLICLDRFTPNIGDSGVCGRAGVVDLAPYYYALAFEAFGDPLFAQYAYLANGRKVKGIHLAVEHPAPEAVQDRILEVVRAFGEPQPPKSDLLEGYGLAILRQGEGEDRRGAWIYFGRNAHFGHCHHDQLNLGLYWRGLDLLPDLGYPDWTVGHNKSDLWVRNTISHNTVVVDRRPQQPNWGGRCTAYGQAHGLVWVEVEADGAYFGRRDEDRFVASRTLDIAGELSPPGSNGVYRRFICMVDLGESFYLLDIFRVSGGREHVWSFHTAEGEVETEDLRLSPQDGGSYLGPEVPFGWGYHPSGFQWLDVVQRDPNPPDRFSLVVHVKGPEKVKLKLTVLNPPGEVALARGYPPKAQGGWLPYILVRNEAPEGQVASGSFVAILEPYLDEPFVREAKVVPVDGDDSFRAFAVKVYLKDGSVHWLFSDMEGTDERIINGQFKFRGHFSFASLSKEGEEIFRMDDGSGHVKPSAPSRI